MTEDKAKDLGVRVLQPKIQLPWVDGLMDGRYSLRIGDIVFDGNPIDANFSRHKANELSWPDFRDPLTEAWLVAWALNYLQESGPWSSISECRGVAKTWIIYDELERKIIAESETRTESWIVALEKSRQK